MRGGELERRVLEAAREPERLPRQHRHGGVLALRRRAVHVHARQLVVDQLDHEAGRQVVAGLHRLTHHVLDVRLETARLAASTLVSNQHHQL